jgi:hypothetical protein
MMTGGQLAADDLFHDGPVEVREQIPRLHS